MLKYIISNVHISRLPNLLSVKPEFNNFFGRWNGIIPVFFCSNTGPTKQDITEKAKILKLEYKDAPENIISRLASCELDKQYTEQRVGQLKAQLKEEKKKVDIVFIPLAIRHVATMIEDECPVKFEVPKVTDPKLQVKIDFSSNDIERVYRWLAILETYKDENNMYVEILHKALEEYFTRKHNIKTITDSKEKFHKFKVAFCKSIVKAINYGNRFVAHTVQTGIRRETLSVYSNPVDKYMTVFYNAFYNA